MNTKQIRYTIVLAIQAILIIVLLTYYGIVMLSPSGSESASSYTQWKERGLIVDRNGKLLAIQVKRDTLTMWKPEITDIEETATLLSEILALNKTYVRDLLRSENRFAIIQRTIPQAAQEKITHLKAAGALKGIHLIPDTIREYPNDRLASQTIGYVGIDNIGLSGIEYVFEEELSRTDGSIAFGNQVTLTIDSELQRYSEGIAKETQEDEQAKSVSIIIMEAKTGEIFALTSYPDFNPNEFTFYSSEERKNPIISDVYEPGSAFKVFSLSSLIQLEGINSQDIFDATAPYQSDDGFQIRDIRSYGFITPKEIIKYSSNVGAAHAADKVTNTAFFYMLKRFGFGEKTNIRLNGESAGIFTPPDQWSARSRQTIAIGQEIGVTALQIVSAATVFANGGILLKPKIVKRVTASDGKSVQTFKKQAVREVISAAVAQEMLSYMHAATEPGGTASRLALEDINVSAKTGTAEIYDVERKQYSQDNFIASTLSLFPTEDPAFIVYMAIHQPSAGRIYGGQIVAPRVKEIIAFMYSYYHMFEDVPTFSIKETEEVLPSLPHFTDILPDFSGLPKRILLPLLRHELLQVEIHGNGWVSTQSPPPGTKIEKNTKLILSLE